MRVPRPGLFLFFPLFLLGAELGVLQHNYHNHNESFRITRTSWLHKLNVLSNQIVHYGKPKFEEQTVELVISEILETSDGVA